MKNYSVRVILGPDTTGAIALVRRYTKLDLRAAGRALHSHEHEPIEIPANRFEEFVEQAVRLGCSVVHGPIPAAAAPDTVTHAQLHEEIKKVQHDIGGLRRHLGMLGHQ